MGIEEFENKIICGDNVEIMGRLPGESVDLSCQSPPYSEMRDYCGYTFDFEKVAQQLWRVTKPGGVAVWVVADQTVNGGKTGESYRQALHFMSLGFRLYQTLYYGKTGTNFVHKTRYTENIEHMFVFSKDQPKTINIIRDVPRLWQGSWAKTRNRQRDGSLKDSTSKNCGAGRTGRATGNEYGYKGRSVLWTIVNGHGFAHSDDLAKGHPASFPEALPRDHILSWTQPGELVLDCCNGGGTTTKMAKWMGRRFIGIDCSREYCDIAEGRLKLVEGKVWVNVETSVEGACDGSRNAGSSDIAENDQTGQ